MKYNTDINSFGGIQDYHMIHEALRSFLNGEIDLKDRMINDNIFGIRTEEGRGRFYRGIKSSILKFNNEKHQDIYNSFFNPVNETYPYNFLIFWQLVLNNRLFRILTKELFFKFYFNGKAAIAGEDVYSFMMHLKEEDEEFKALNWTKKTIEPVASKYLTVLKKLGFLEGTQKKIFKNIHISDSELTVFLYLMKAANPEVSNQLVNEFQVFSFVSSESFPERIKKIAQKGWIGMSYSGPSLTIDPLIENKNLADVLYSRS